MGLILRFGYTLNVPSTSFTYSEGCCSLFRIVGSIICSHKVLFDIRVIALLYSDLLTD